MTWKDTHPEHDIPDWVTQLGFQQDFNNDPESLDVAFVRTFGTGLIELWVYHPDPGQRDTVDDYRFYVTINVDRVHDEDVTGIMLTTDDSKVAEAATRWLGEQLSNQSFEAFVEQYGSTLLWKPDGAPLVPDLRPDSPSALKDALVEADHLFAQLLACRRRIQEAMHRE